MDTASADRLPKPITGTEPLCVVVGAGGFIGINLCKRLQADGWRVRAFGPGCRYPEGVADTEWYRGRLSDQAVLARCLEGVSVVFHLACSTVPVTSGKHMLRDLDSDLIGTVRLFESSCDAGVKRIVFLSTGGAIYRASALGVYNEESPTNPTTAYGVIKLAAEKYLEIYHSQRGVEYVTLRLSNPFGPFQRLDGVQGVVGYFLHQAMLGRPLEVWGDGSSVRDYIYVGDVVDALVLAGGSGSSQGVFNIGSGSGRALIELIEALETLLSRKLTIFYRPGNPVQPKTNVLNISAAESSLRWQPRTSFEQGLRLTKDWLDRLSVVNTSVCMSDKLYNGAQKHSLSREPTSGA